MFMHLPAQLLTVPLSTLDVKMVWTPNERNNRMNCNILLKNCILNDFVLCTNEKVKHYEFYLYEKQILKICSETHSLSGIRSKMKILPCLSLFVILTAGKDLKPEEHWRPATGKDLSKYENKDLFHFSSPYNIFNKGTDQELRSTKDHHL